jgi:hypothetical protein
VPDELRDEIVPNNIIMIGPTGVGKTEIARRLARLAGAPFVKVEASKFTEVGYVGRDVESMIRDLVDVAINMVRNEREEEVQEVAEQRVEERLLDLLIPPLGGGSRRRGGGRRPARLRRHLHAARRIATSRSRTAARSRATATRSAGSASGASARGRSSAGCSATRSSRSARSRSRSSSPPLDNMMVPMGGMEGMDFNFTRCCRTSCRRRPSGGRSRSPRRGASCSRTSSTSSSTWTR